MLKFKENTTINEVNRVVNMGLSRHLGIEVTALGERNIEARMLVTEKHKQPFGLMNGGASAVMAETLGSIGSNMMIDQDQYNAVGIEVQAQHLRSILGGYLYAVAEPIHTGRKLHVWEIKMTDESKKLICIAKLSVMIVNKSEVKSNK